MKVLILNSGLGTRLGELTKEHPKCMTPLKGEETILSRQLEIIKNAGLKDVVITTGYFDKVLVEYCNSLGLPLNFEFVLNPSYDSTNYIYSIYCAEKAIRDDDLILMHGDLVFDQSVFEEVLNSKKSCMTVSSTVALPEKDFKAVLEGDRITKVGIEFFDNAVAAQPLYKLSKDDWNKWLDKICEYCETNNRKCYAENAFNEISDECKIYPLDVKDALCSEIDTCEDWENIKKKL